MNEQDKMEKRENKFINAMTKQIKSSTIREEKSTRWTTEAIQKHVENMANISSPRYTRQNTNNYL